MFSANENLALRQHKKRIVEMVEACIPESVLDMGTMVMVMQVSCKAPGCVPLETAIIIVFPQHANQTELLPGLPESGSGGNYKTKILKPMVEVTQNDVYEALPPAFKGGKRSIEKLCIQTRDIMLGQITQLFADDDIKGRNLMAKYLQQSLQEYIDRDCNPPEWGEPFSPLLLLDEKKTNGNEEMTQNNVDKKILLSSVIKNETATAKTNDKNKTTENEGLSSTATAAGVTKTGNFVFKRPVDDDDDDNDKSSRNPTNPNPPGTATSTNTFTSNNTNKSSTVTTSSQSILAQIEQHAPGIRVPGCPCCDPDNPETIIDQMMI